MFRIPDTTAYLERTASHHDDWKESFRSTMSVEEVADGVMRMDIWFGLLHALADGRSSLDRDLMLINQGLRLVAVGLRWLYQATRAYEAGLADALELVTRSSSELFFFGGAVLSAPDPAARLRELVTKTSPRSVGASIKELASEAGMGPFYDSVYAVTSAKSHNNPLRDLVIATPRVGGGKQLTGVISDFSLMQKHLKACELFLSTSVLIGEAMTLDLQRETFRTCMAMWRACFGVGTSPLDQAGRKLMDRLEGQAHLSAE